jgi:hypothetical protein
MTPPQPSGAKPQTWPAGQVVLGAHPQWLGVPPPPQVNGGAQVPQLMTRPQSSSAVPQS